MIADFAIHDPHPPGHNPHAHVLLTMRAMDEQGKWLPKSRKVYDLDENGERIKLPSGRWKSHKEDTVDWNDQKYCEIWRHEWEVIQNRYLEANNRPERVDLRSYARQGLDIVPTVHEGAAVRQMEKRGIQTNIGNLTATSAGKTRDLHPRWAPKGRPSGRPYGKYYYKYRTGKQSPIRILRKKSHGSRESKPCRRRP